MSPGTDALPAWYPDRLPRRELPTLLVFAGVWLVFLVQPVVVHTVSALSEEDLTGALQTALGGAAFVLVYLTAFVRPRPVAVLPGAGRELPRWVNTLGYTVLLLGCVALLAVRMGPDVVAALPFLVAVWVFPNALRVGLVAAGVLVAAGLTAVATVVPEQDRQWMLVPVLLPTLTIVLMRWATGRDEDHAEIRRRLGLAEQRERLSRDLHDILGHSLTTINVKAQLVERLMDTDPNRARAEAAAVVELSRSALAEARAAVADLAVPELGAQLSTSVAALRDAGIEVTAPPHGAVAEVPAARRELAAWFLREASTNVLRHARARRVVVELDGDGAVLTDDGVGVPAHVAAGTGLRTLRARARDAGARLEASTPAPGDFTDGAGPGTRLSLHWRPDDEEDRT